MPITPNNIKIASEQKEKMAFLEKENKKLKESSETLIKNLIDEGFDLSLILRVNTSLSESEVRDIYQKYKK